MTIGIYKITNTINGKCYIGKSKNIEARYEGHFNAALVKKMQSKFYTAIRKYGKNNFNLQILHELNAVNEDELNRLEILEIKMHNSFGENGYNMTPGGDGVTQLSEESLIKMKKTLSNTIKKMYADGKIQPQRSWLGRKHTEESKSKIGKSNSGENNGMYGKKPWNKNLKYDNAMKVKFGAIPVIAYNLDNTIHKKYDNMTDAMNDTNIAKSSICKCCKRKIKRAGMYIWRYEGDVI